jgi:hypothetical protein
MRKPLLLSALATALLVTGPAASQDAKDEAMAEAVFQQALKLFDGGKEAEACPLFEQSFRLDPKASTKMNVALCYEKVGRTASAWGAFTEAATLADKAGQTKRSESAREHQKDLAAKLSKVTLSHTREPAQIALSLDGKALDAVMLGVPLPLDPGKHRVEATAPGYQAWSAEINVPPGPAEVPVPIPALVKKPEPVQAPSATATAPVVTAAPSASHTAAPKPPAETGPSGARIGAYASFAVGGAGLLAGIITGAVAGSMASGLKSRCVGGTCYGQDRNDLATANGMANASNATFAIGGAGAVLGVVLLLASSPSKDEKGEPKVEAVGMGDVGLGVRARF